MRERDCRANYSSVSRYKRRTVRTRCDPDAARWATLFPHVPLARVPCASKLSNPFQRYRTRIHLLLDPIQPIWSAVVGALQRGAASVASSLCREVRAMHHRPLAPRSALHSPPTLSSARVTMGGGVDGGGGLRIPNYIYATQPLHTYFLLLPPIHSTLVTASSLISLPIQRNIRRSVPLHPHPSRSSEMHIHALPLNSRNHIMEMVGMPEKTPRVNQVVSLFCGAGGFCQGCVEAGCKVVLAVDSDEKALKTHRANHPDTLHLCSAARSRSNRLRNLHVRYSAPTICNGRIFTNSRVLRPAGDFVRNFGKIRPLQIVGAE